MYSISYPDIPRPAVVLIAALDDNRVIGDDNRLPWRLPADLRRFKALTLHHPVIMGRKTFDSIGRALPQRDNIVISRRADAAFAGCRRAASAEEALEMVGDVERVFVIGGAQIYRLFLPYATAMHLTEINASYHGDARFPEFDASQWRRTVHQYHDPSDGHPGFTFAEYTPAYSPPR